MFFSIFYDKYFNTLVLTGPYVVATIVYIFFSHFKK